LTRAIALVIGTGVLSLNGNTSGVRSARFVDRVILALHSSRIFKGLVFPMLPCLSRSSATAIPLKLDAKRVPMLNAFLEWARWRKTGNRCRKGENENRERK